MAILIFMCAAEKLYAFNFFVLLFYNKNRKMRLAPPKMLMYSSVNLKIRKCVLLFMMV